MADFPPNAGAPGGTDTDFYGELSSPGTNLLEPVTKSREGLV